MACLGFPVAKEAASGFGGGFFREKSRIDDRTLLVEVGPRALRTRFFARSAAIVFWHLTGSDSMDIYCGMDDETETIFHTYWRPSAGVYEGEVEVRFRAEEL